MAYGWGRDSDGWILFDEHGRIITTVRVFEHYNAGQAHWGRFDFADADSAKAAVMRYFAGGWWHRLMATLGFRLP